MTAQLVTDATGPREEWLAARQRGVTATDIPAVLGISPWSSPFSLYWRKAGVLNGDDGDTDAMRWGRRLEQPIADEFADRHPEFDVADLPFLSEGVDNIVQRSVLAGCRQPRTVSCWRISCRVSYGVHNAAARLHWHGTVSTINGCSWLRWLAFSFAERSGTSCARNAFHPPAR